MDHRIPVLVVEHFFGIRQPLYKTHKGGMSTVLRSE